MRTEIRVTIPNPLAWAIYRLRHRAAARKWNRDVPWIEAHVLPGEGYDPGSFFSWSQLVWQEIWMWAKIGDRVTESSFAWTCDRRGFNETQRAYLRRMLGHLWLGPVPDPVGPPRIPWWQFRERRRAATLVCVKADPDEYQADRMDELWEGVAEKTMAP